MLHLIIFVFHITVQSKYYTFNNPYQWVHVKYSTHYSLINYHRLYQFDTTI